MKFGLIVGLFLVLTTASFAGTNAKQKKKDARVPSSGHKERVIKTKLENFCPKDRYPNFFTELKHEDGDRVRLSFDGVAGKEGRLTIPVMFEGWDFDQEKLTLKNGDSVIHVEVFCGGDE
jgi:hypothetical protein